MATSERLLVWIVLLVVAMVVMKSEGVNSPAPQPRDLYELLPPYNETSISLPEFLDSLPKTPAGREILNRMISVLEKTTGFIIPESIVQQFFNNTDLIFNYTSVSIRDMSDIWTTANIAYWKNETSQVNTSFPLIPASPFVFPSGIYTAPLNMSNWIPTLEYIGDNLFWGFPFPKTTSRVQATINSVMSLVFNQLADNIHLKSNSPEWSQVQYKENTYTSIEEFLSALLADGWSVECFLEWHVAQFFGIYSNASGNATALKPVADPIMQMTGIWNKDNTEQVILPAAHSQWMFIVRNISNGFYFALEWYQGDTSYGFYPSEMYVITEWSGRSVAYNYTGKDAIRSIAYMGFVQDVWVAGAESMNLFDAGYGVTGVCDDSCGMVELMMGSSSLMYPFLIQKQLVVPEVLRRINKHDENEALYYNMLKAVNGLPVDWEGLNPTSVKRALESIVWPPGKEPWQCVVDGRKILTGLGF